MNSRPKVPWSRGDKFLMLLLGLVLPLCLSGFFWLRALDRNPTASIPTPAMPSPNARDYYIAATAALVDSGKVDNANGRWNPATKPVGDNHFYSPADKQKLVAENAKAIKTLHEGFRYSYQELPYRSYSDTFPHFQQMRKLARFLSLEAQVDADKGDWGGSIGADLDAVQLGETMPRGGPLIGMLVGDACQAIGRKRAWDAVDHLDAAQARAAARRLETIRAGHVPFPDTMQQEEWMGQGGLLELMRRPNWSGEMAGSIAPDPSGAQNNDTSPGRWVFATRIRLLGKRKIFGDYTQALDQIIADGHKPFAARGPAPAAAQTADPFADMVTPSLGGTRMNEVRADTQNALLLTLLALRAYKLDHGAYPLALSALVPRYLAAVPADPFALSGPLRYKLAGARPLLYSVGPDGKDDGGKAIFDRTLPAPTNADGYDRRRAVQENSAGDVVAGVNTS